jgi:hypothetical protein
MKKLILLFILGFSCCYLQDISAQSLSKDRKFEVDLGLGFPDLLHLGMKYQLTKLSTIGMSYGTILIANKSRHTSAVTLEHAYHFGKHSEDSKLPVYYFTQKVTYLNDIKKDITANIFYFTPSVGKSFYGGGPFGINIDAGLNFKVYQSQETDLITEGRVFEQFPSVFPAIRFQFFFNL